MEEAKVPEQLFQQSSLEDQMFPNNSAQPLLNQHTQKSNLTSELDNINLSAQDRLILEKSQ